MQKNANRTIKKSKQKRRGGILAGTRRQTRLITALVIAIACVVMAFTQLGFIGLGLNGEYSVYLILEFVPIALAALLLGPLIGMCMGVFAGAMLWAHAALLPLDYYELTFVTPLTSVIMMGVTGLILGLLFKFVLRNDPHPVKAAIYITIVCFIMSVLYSAGFVINAILSLAFDLVETSSPDASSEQLTIMAQERALSIVLRMGSVEWQAIIDAALMAVSCIVAYVVVAKLKCSKETRRLRATFAVHLSVVVFVAFMITSAASFVAITQGELSASEKAMKDEMTYLENQIKNANKRLAGLTELIKNEKTEEALTDTQLQENLTAYSIDSVLDGYSPDADGIIFVALDAEELQGIVTDITSGSIIVSSDDSRFAPDSKVEDVAGDEVTRAIEVSLVSGDIKRAVYDEINATNLETALKQGDITAHSQIVYVLAKTVGEYEVVIMLPASKVFAGRTVVMGWTTLSVFALLAAVFAMVFLLLDRVVARRIDETNGVLARITEGDLDARIEVRDTREFESLSGGINTTVDALKGWIAEAESRIDAELATAKAIQQSALPTVFPPFPDILKFDVFASMKAAREVGGDFYDFFLVGDDSDADSGKLGFVIADVSGKGVPAALFMMKSMTQLRDYLKVGMEVGEAMENANRQLCEGNDEGMFVTAWAGVLDYATGHVEYANAGHNPPLLWQKENGWQWLTEKSGLPLGLFEGLPYEAYSVECGIGDQFLLYTDGVTEAMSVDGELYGEDRLKELVSDCFVLHPRMLVQALRSDVATWAKGAEQSDDITVLALEVGVPPELTATLKLPAKVENLPSVNEFIHSELDRRLCPKRVQNQLDIAVEELFVNVCHYAYPDATPENPGSVCILRTYSADPPCVVVDIIDEGIPYDPLAKPDAVTPDNIADVPIGGLGILMAKKCTDEMRYERSGESNIVTIVKKW